MLETIFSIYSGLGVDYYVDLFLYSSATGDTPVLDDTGAEVGRAPVSFTSNSFTVRVPLALIGRDDGIVDTATVLGTILEPTDACPKIYYQFINQFISSTRTDNNANRTNSTCGLAFGNRCSEYKSNCKEDYKERINYFL